MPWTHSAKEEPVDRKLKRRLAIGGVVLATFGAAGGAYAVASSSDNPRDAYLNDLASRLHVSRDQLDSAMKGAFEDRLDAAVKAGKLTQQQEDNMLSRLNANIDNLVNLKPGAFRAKMIHPRFKHGFARPGGPHV